MTKYCNANDLQKEEIRFLNNWLVVQNLKMPIMEYSHPEAFCLTLT